MFGTLTWSFHLENDFTGRYETIGFNRYYWVIFFSGAGLYLLGTLGLSGTLRPRAAVRVGITAFVAGLVLLFILMPSVDFEGWTGAATYTMTAVVLTGAVIMLVLTGLKRLWQRVRAPAKFR